MFFLSRGLYGQRKLTHVNAYRLQPRWWFFEVASWTLEVDLNRSLLNRHTKLGLFAGALLPTPYVLAAEYEGWAVRIVQALGFGT